MKHPVLLLFASVALLSACDSDRKVTGVAIEPGVSAVITRSGEARVDGDVETNISGSVLHVYPATKGNVDAQIPAFVYWPQVTEIYTRGHSELLFEDIDTRRLEIDARGTSRVIVTGVTEELDILTGGDAEIDASELDAEDVWLEATGNTFTVAFADSSAYVTLGGNAQAVILGDPVETQEDVSGSASVSWGQ